MMKFSIVMNVIAGILLLNAALTQGAIDGTGALYGIPAICCFVVALANSVYIWKTKKCK